MWEPSYTTDLRPGRSRFSAITMVPIFRDQSDLNTVKQNVRVQGRMQPEKLYHLSVAGDCGGRWPLVKAFWSDDLINRII